MTSSILNIANNYSLKALLNSLIRDFSGDERIDIDDRFELKIKEGMISINILKKSLLGLHEYQNQIYLNEQLISFDDFVFLVAKNFASEFNKEKFVHSTLLSRDNIAQIILDNDKELATNYLESEKKIIARTSFSPLP